MIRAASKTLMLLVAVATLAGCTVEDTVDNTVQGTAAVGKTVVKGTVGAVKIVGRGAANIVSGD